MLCCLQAGTAPHVREEMIQKAVNKYGKLPNDPTVKVLPRECMLRAQLPPEAGSDAVQQLCRVCIARCHCDVPLQAWQMKIGDSRDSREPARFVDVEAHVLPAPNLQYKERTQPVNTGQLGAWNLRQVGTWPSSS
jgi:hypothetical protein